MYFDIFFYLFIGITIIFIITMILLRKRLRFKHNQIILLNQQHTAKIDMIRKDHSDTLENIRVVMLKHEQDRTQQWVESEKETLFVLSGVSNLLDLSDKINRVETDKILKLLQKIKNDTEEIKKT